MNEWRTEAPTGAHAFGEITTSGDHLLKVTDHRINLQKKLWLESQPCFGIPRLIGIDTIVALIAHLKLGSPLLEIVTDSVFNEQLLGASFWNHSFHSVPFHVVPSVF